MDRPERAARKYLSFFESKGHLRLDSFPLVPNNDNSLLLSTPAWRDEKMVPRPGGARRDLEYKLVSTQHGPRLRMEPVEEIAAARKERIIYFDDRIKVDSAPVCLMKDTKDMCWI